MQLHIKWFLWWVPPSVILPLKMLSSLCGHCTYWLNHLWCINNVKPCQGLNLALVDLLGHYILDTRAHYSSRLHGVSMGSTPTRDEDVVDYGVRRTSLIWGCKCNYRQIGTSRLTLSTEASPITWMQVCLWHSVVELPATNPCMQVSY